MSRARILLVISILILLPAEKLRAAVEVVPTTEVLRSGTLQGDRLHWTSPGGQVLEILLDPSTAGISNPAVGEDFVPHSPQMVGRALSELSAGASAIEATIYLLPGLPSRTRRSFCVGSEIFLAAALATPPAEVVAYTVVHELGHAAAHRFLPNPKSPAWERYLYLRSLTEADGFHAWASHRDRPAEIFAEDFRMLYGGPLATSSGSLENPTLDLPATVPGLGLYFAKLLSGQLGARNRIAAVANYPNPFNPRTTIRIELREDLLLGDSPVRVQIFDLRGRMVQEIQALRAAAEIEFHWDGRDREGRRVASGQYRYRVSLGDEFREGKMLLIE